MSARMVAVVTGRHPFDVLGFHAMVRSLPEADCYVQNMEDFANASLETRARYDVVLFYNMHMATPTGEEGLLERGVKAALEGPGEAGQGIFLMHHALLAFPQWPLWSEIVGITDRSFGYYHDQQIQVCIANREHPITRGLEPWEMVDETYTMADAGEGSDILLTLEHPNSMRTIAWTRRYRSARVFCLQLGHDDQAYAHPNFRTLVARGIAWCGHALP